MLWEAQTGENGKAKKVLFPLSVRERTFPRQPAIQNATTTAELGAEALAMIRVEWRTLLSRLLAEETTTHYLSRRD